MKRILSFILSLIVLLSACPAVFAADDVPVLESVRVFNAGTVMEATLTGTPGNHVSVIVLEPGVTLPDMSTDYAVFNDGVQHIDSENLDENGELKIKYVAKNAGVYTIYATGVSNITSSTDYAPEVNPDRIYVESWTSGATYSHPDLNYVVSLSKTQLDTYGAEAVAQNIWGQLEDKPEGRRTIFINNNLSPYKSTPVADGSRIWWDEGAEIVAASLDAFFEEFKNIGGSVDFLYADMEHTLSNYAYTSGDGVATRETELAKIYNHERWPEFKAELEARGYDFTLDGETTLSSIYKSYTNYTNYLAFNAVCSQMAADYYTQAIYEPAKKHFAGVKYAEYGFGDRKTWLGGYEMTTHPNYKGGNLKVAGTHSAPPLYSKRTQNFVYQEIFGIPGETGSTDAKHTVYAGAGSDFNELQGTIAMLRVSANATKNNTITPWVATESVGKDSFDDARYRAEMIMHIALHNPDRLLHYNPGTDETLTAEQQSEILMTVLDEVNGLVAYEDRRSLNVDQADFSLPFALSGIYANGKNIWRITPDTSVVASAAFLAGTSEGGVDFSSDVAKVHFPQGKLIEVEDTTSDIGFWVETPEGVTPVISYADQSVEEDAVISFYDVKYGKKADLETENVVDAVASFRGFYGEKLNFIAAKYDANGTLIDIETKECGIFAPHGNAAFIEIGKDVDTAAIKFFLWEDETIRPLASEEM